MTLFVIVGASLVALVGLFVWACCRVAALADRYLGAGE